MSVARTAFGHTTRGEEVDEYILKNASGMKVKVITYGAAIVSIEAPDAKGHMADVVLGFDDMAGYLSTGNPYFGCCCGRFANRLAKGTFTIDGTEYSVAINNGPNGLHGGLVGFDKKVWKAEIVGDGAVKLSLLSPDGEEGYPGNLAVELIYTLTDENELKLEYRATTDRKTILNLTNHSYFNLAGSGSVHNHLIHINADRYTVVDEHSTPTGELRPVAGTEMDLLEATPIGKNIHQVQGLGYDHNYCINQAAAGELTVAAFVVEPHSGRTMECLTTEPGVQFYTGNYIEHVKGKNGAIYDKQEGFCLETQHYPDSPNHPEFPSTELKPGDTYTQTTIYRFGVQD
ncbi:MAG: galactose mutarotase [Pontiellaceae bacterium]|nr:galactose mutarotase [Pontiellaceae bacterium]MBN2785653.1 galactose mutarotase [Pontiellaceae bacterium]